MKEFWLYFGLILTWLFGFGIAYNMIVAWMQKHSYAEGYMSHIVIVGVMVTLVGVALLDVRAAGLCLAAFAASGTPMAAGSIWRHMKARNRDRIGMIRGSVEE